YACTQRESGLFGLANIVLDLLPKQAQLLFEKVLNVLDDAGHQRSQRGLRAGLHVIGHDCHLRMDRASKKPTPIPRNSAGMGFRRIRLVRSEAIPCKPSSSR